MRAQRADRTLELMPPRDAAWSCHRPPETMAPPTITSLVDLRVATLRSKRCKTFTTLPPSSESKRHSLQRRLHHTLNVLVVIKKERKERGQKHSHGKLQNLLKAPSGEIPLLLWTLRPSALTALPGHRSGRLSFIFHLPIVQSFNLLSSQKFNLSIFH